VKKNYDVAIITGWSNMGGSTESYINLTNKLNQENIKTILVGPHPYHLTKCDGALFTDIPDITCTNLILHFVKYDNEMMKTLGASNKILSCHEHDINKIFLNYNPNDFDHFHFVSEHQKEYQLGYSPLGTKKDCNMIVIPNLIDPTLKVSSRPDKKIGGVIGSIDRNKQTHISIQNALKDGCDRVNVFGAVTDQLYFTKIVSPMLQLPNVEYHGVEEDKSKMYSSITDIYHFSLKETWGYIKAECKYLNIPYHSNNVDDINIMSSDDIMEKWRRILK
jgi:hypothetical protein